MQIILTTGPIGQKLTMTECECVHPAISKIVHVIEYLAGPSDQLRQLGHGRVLALCVLMWYLVVPAVELELVEVVVVPNE